MELYHYEFILLLLLRGCQSLIVCHMNRSAIVGDMTLSAVSTDDNRGFLSALEHGQQLYQKITT